MGTHATLDGLLELRRDHLHHGDGRRRARGDSGRPRIRRSLHRPHGGNHLDGGRRLARRDGASVRSAATGPGDLGAALRARDFRGSEGLPPRGRLHLDVPAGGQRPSDAAIRGKAGAAAAAGRALHRVAAADHRRRRLVGAVRAGDQSVPASVHDLHRGVPRRAFGPQGRLLSSSRARPGAYFSHGVAPVSIWLSTKYSRAAKGGTGAAKTGGNYAASLLPQAEAYEHGCDQVLFLDAAEGKYIEELGGMNVVLVYKDGTLVTPASDSILEGITRDSVLKLARDKRPHRRGAPRQHRRVARRRRIRRHRRDLRLRHRRRGHPDRAAQGRGLRGRLSRCGGGTARPWNCARSSPTSNMGAPKTGTAG